MSTLKHSVALRSTLAIAASSSLVSRSRAFFFVSALARLKTLTSSELLPWNASSEKSLMLAVPSILFPDPVPTVTVTFSVTDPEVLRDSIDRAIAAGIPVITLDADAPASKRLFFIGTNNFEAGLMGGQRLAQLLKEKGNVVFFTISEQNNLADRLRGYREALVRYPQIHVIRTVDIGGNPDVASNTVAEILAQHPGEVDAFVCLEAQAGRNVAIALNERHVQNKIVLAMDTDPDTLDWIDKGVISATIAQKPYTMTMVGLRVLDDLHHYPPPRLTDNWSQDSFAPIPAFIDTGSDITKR